MERSPLATGLQKPNFVEPEVLDRVARVCTKVRTRVMQMRMVFCLWRRSLQRSRRKRLVRTIGPPFIPSS